MNSNLQTLIILAAGALSAGAGAQGVYRCGNTYSQQPCAGAAAMQVEDARSAAQKAQTSEAARRDAKTADAMEKARLKEEAKPAPAYIPVTAAASGNAAAEKRNPVMSKPEKPKYFTAVSPRVPGEEKKKTSKKKA